MFMPLALEIQVEDTSIRQQFLRSNRCRQWGEKVTCKEIREDSSSRSATFVTVMRKEVSNGPLP